jgi:hypothetical protein
VFYVDWLLLQWPPAEWPDGDDPHTELLREDLAKVLLALSVENSAFERATVSDLSNAIQERAGVTASRVLGKLGSMCGAYGDSARDKKAVDDATDRYDKAQRRARVQP